MEHKWEICEMCGPFVRCGYCGNNCCNGGTGTLPDGKECGCKEAYAQQDSGGIPQEMRGWVRDPNYDPRSDIGL